MSAILNIPVLEITGGVDPSNIKWRTNPGLYNALCERFTKMTKFMKLLRLDTMSTHLVFNGTEFRVLIDNKKINS